MNFRAISISGYERPPVRDLGARPTLDWFDVADLVVDETYQRRISREGQRAVRRIAAEFDWSFFSPLIIAPIEGKKYAIIDGQHRATAAMLVGIRKVPCELVLADPRQQAAAFAAINGKIQRASAMQIYHAARAAGETWALRVDRVCQAAGVTILKYPISAALPERPRHSTMSAKTIEQLVNRYGSELATDALNCITKSELGDDPAILGHLWMRAIASALNDRPKLREDSAALHAFFDDIDAGALAASLERSKGVTASEALALRLGAALDKAFPEARGTA